MLPWSRIVLTVLFSLINGCAFRQAGSQGQGQPRAPAAAPAPAPRVVRSLSPARQKILANAQAQTRTTRIYDPAYVSLSYPGGDVPPERGVCADVIVRAFRAASLDLQSAVHNDMRANFRAYPRLWGLKRPDPNIDHRRVANLMTFFRRQHQALPITSNAADYRAGDVVAWELPGGRLHIGLTCDQCVTETERPEVIHNIGSGTQQEDVLFAWKIIGHYRSFP